MHVHSPICYDQLKETDNYNSLCARVGGKKCLKKGKTNEKKYLFLFHKPDVFLCPVPYPIN